MRFRSFSYTTLFVDSSGGFVGPQKGETRYKKRKRMIMTLIMVISWFCVMIMKNIYIKLKLRSTVDIFLL